MGEEARVLGSGHATWLESRGIEQELAVGMGLYSARTDRNGGGNDNEEKVWREPIPDQKGPILVFPYLDAAGEVNAKFRGPQKRFYQRPKARKTFWNAIVLDDPLLIQGDQALVITEGEIDALTAIQGGHPWSVSVPDGAPADVDSAGRPIPMKPDREIDPEHDAKFEYVLNNWDRLAKIKRIVLAADGDGPGRRLRDELARRLGRVRCATIEYPPDLVVPIEGEFGAHRACKDLNEVHMHIGSDAVLALIQRARPYPVSGLYTLDDYDDHREIECFEIGIDPGCDSLMKLYRGAFVVASGVPQHGKSAYVDQIAFTMAQRYGWNTAFCSLEEPVRPHLRNKLARFYIRKRRENFTPEDNARADAFIRRHFCFITDDPKRGDVEETATVEWLCDRAADAVIRYGIDMLVVDPWNELDHKRRGNEMRDEYVSRAVRALKRFAALYDVVVIVVVHPTKAAGDRVMKDGSKSKEDEVLSIYDVADGAVWFNKAELAFIVTRSTEANHVGRATSRIDVKKVKFHEAGRLGHAMITFDTHLRMFTDDPTLLQEPLVPV